MKQSNFIPSVIIPGKKSPGEDMDVYMQLTIDDLLELWNDGVWTYDASRSKKFLLHAALLWTISDWPGRGSLSGENIAVCSHCLSETCSLWLKNGHKKCYMGIIDSWNLITSFDLMLSHLMVLRNIESLMFPFIT